VMCEQTATRALPARTNPVPRNALETAEFAISGARVFESLFSNL